MVLEKHEYLFANKITLHLSSTVHMKTNFELAVMWKLNMKFKKENIEDFGLISD